MPAVFNGVANRLKSLCRQSDHEENINARTAQAHCFLDDRFHILGGVTGFALLSVAYRLTVTFGAELHAPVAHAFVDVPQERCRRQREKFEYDLVRQLRAAQALKNLSRMLGTRHKEVANQQNGS